MWHIHSPPVVAGSYLAVKWSLITREEPKMDADDIGWFSNMFEDGAQLPGRELVVRYNKQTLSSSA
jgi:hypothetical protein